MTGRDCKDCRNCQGIHGFMAKCSRTWNEQKGENETWCYCEEKDTARSHARVCEFYEGRRDEDD